MDRASALSPSSLETVRRIAESVIIAVISSAALYLVGSVYVDAYYGRLAIEVTSLDLPPPYVALQSVHALWGLLDYPLMLLLVYVLYRTLASPSRRLWVNGSAAPGSASRGCCPLWPTSSSWPHCSWMPPPVCGSGSCRIARC